MGPIRVITGLLDTQALLWAFAADDRLPTWLGEDIDRDPGSFGVSDVQARDLGVPVVTGDPAMSAYDVAVLW